MRMTCYVNFVVRMIRPHARRSSAALILLYHRIATAEQDPWEMCVSPDNFREHLQVLQRYPCVRLEEIGSKTPESNRVAITFDDGYADNLYTGMPALEQFDVPATFFITTGRIDTAREFWWDELEQLILNDSGPTRIAFTIGDSIYEWNRETNEATGISQQPWWPPGDNTG